jgi:predicted nucleic acid-binding protein
VTRAIVDTNVFVRALTGDHPAMSAACRDLFRRAARGEVALATSEAVVAEVCYVLTSRATYALDRATVAKVLRPVLSLRALGLNDKRVVLAALDRWAMGEQRKFVDCLIAEHALAGGGPVYSYDRGFDRIAGLLRHEP